MVRGYDRKVYEYEPLLPDSVIAHSGTKPLLKPDRKMDAVSVAPAQSGNKGITEVCRYMNSHPVLIDVRSRARQQLEGQGVIPEVMKLLMYDEIMP